MDQPKPGEEESHANPEVSPTVSQLVHEALRRDAIREETRRAIRESRNPTASLRGLFWKSFLILGVAGSFWLLSLAVRDPINFRDGIYILRHLAWQFAVTLFVWSGATWFYWKSAPALRKKIERALRWVGVALFVVFLYFILGFPDRGIRSIWGNGWFLGTLALQVGAFLFLFKSARRWRKEVEDGDERPELKCLLIYSSEAAMIYLCPFIFLQIFLKANVPLMVSRILHSGPGLTLFCIPFFSYVICRKIFGKL